MRPSSTTLLLAGAASALVLAAQPAAAAIAFSGELNIVANASTHSGSTVSSSDSQNWSAVPAALNVSANAVATAGVFQDHNERVAAFGSAAATWTSANAGSVDFTGYGWNYSVKDPAPLASATDLAINRPGSGVDWIYSFTATGDGVFQMNYDVAGQGTTNGLYGWGIHWSGGPSSGGPDLNTLGADPTVSGVFQANVTAGQFYTVFLANNANLAACCSRNFSGSMDGSFDWQITERAVVDGGGVPEPAGWALMLVGFGGMGAMVRSRRRAATT